MQSVQTKGMPAPEPIRMSIDQLKKREAQGEQFTFIDTRGADAWNSSDLKIPGALRIPLDQADEQLEKLGDKDRTFIAYCT